MVTLLMVTMLMVINPETEMSETILDTIVEDSAADLSRRKQQHPLSSLRSMPGFSRAPLPLAPALRSESLSIIAEIKRKSPSKGLLRKDFYVDVIARSYASANARAISVLTEVNHFDGSLADLASVRASVALPILRKDFLVDPYQLVEARAYGADAVLLIATILDRNHLAEMISAASELELSCLVELYDERELDHVDLDQISVLGVNNRNLHTFEVDITRAPKLLAQIPEDIIRVAESGLSTGRDLAEMQRLGIDAALIGEALISKSDPGEALTLLRNDCDRDLNDA
jgi:indole-3-glycerol phosphate synthase